MFTISKKVTISAAHSLPSLPPTHKCHALHGHNYTITIVLEAATLDRHGFVLDFGVITDVVKKYDHKNLNDLLPIQNATAEIFACRLFGEVARVLNRKSRKSVRVVSVEVSETEGAFARYSA